MIVSWLMGCISCFIYFFHPINQSFNFFLQSNFDVLTPKLLSFFLFPTSSSSSFPSSSLWQYTRYVKWAYVLVCWWIKYDWDSIRIRVIYCDPGTQHFKLVDKKTRVRWERCLNVFLYVPSSAVNLISQLQLNCQLAIMNAQIWTPKFSWRGASNVYKLNIPIPFDMYK